MVDMHPSLARSTKLFCSIEGTGFVSVSAILAAILLLIPMVVVEHLSGTSLELALANHPISMPGANRKDALVVAIMRSGSVFFGNNKITPEELSLQVREGLSPWKERTIYMKVDAHSKYSDVAAVLDNLRSAGVRRVSFLLNQRKVSVRSR